MFHIFSLVCFLICGVKRRQVLIPKPRFLLLLFQILDLFFIHNFMIIIKINDFLKKIGPIWAPTRTGPRNTTQQLSDWASKGLVTLP